MMKIHEEDQYNDCYGRERMYLGDMSLSIGQNAGYINNIETGKALPSMTSFFYICEYLGITPQEFFDADAEQPKELSKLISDLKKLNKKQLENIADIVNDLANGNRR